MEHPICRHGSVIISWSSNSNLVGADLHAGLCGQVRLDRVDGEGADGAALKLKATVIVNVSDCREEKTDRNMSAYDKEPTKAGETTCDFQKHIQ